MAIQENKTLVLRFVDEVQNQHNLAAIDALFSPDFIDHSDMTGSSGIEGTKAFFTMMFAAFPDMHFTVLQQLAEGDRVMTYKTFHGTHLGPFMGIPATGRQVTTDVIDICSVEDGKLAEHWTVTDLLSLLQQLGVVQMPQQAGA